MLAKFMPALALLAFFGGAWLIIRQPAGDEDNPPTKLWKAFWHFMTLVGVLVIAVASVGLYASWSDAYDHTQLRTFMGVKTCKVSMEEKQLDNVRVDDDTLEWEVPEGLEPLLFLIEVDVKGDGSDLRTHCVGCNERKFKKDHIKTAKKVRLWALTPTGATFPNAVTK